NRTTLVKVALQGIGEPLCTPIPREDTDWYDPSLACTPYDPAGAQRLVAASGFGHPTLHLLIPNNTVSLQVAEVSQAEEAKAGFNVVIDAAAGSTVQALAQSGNFDVYYTSTTVGPDPDSMLYGQFSTGGSQNTSGYSSPRMDYVLANSRKATTL